MYSPLTSFSHVLAPLFVVKGLPVRSLVVGRSVASIPNLSQFLAWKTLELPDFVSVNLANSSSRAYIALSKASFSFPS